MAIGKGSMERAAKAVKSETKAVKSVVKAEAVQNESVKKDAVQKTVKKKPAPKKAQTAKKTPAASVVTPTKQVMDMVVCDQIAVGDDMPIYYY